MDAIHFFDSERYFSSLCAGNRLAQEHKFHFCTCSGIGDLQGPLSEFRNKAAFFCLDDVNDGSLVRGKNGGWFKNRTFTVFLLHRYDGSLQDRAAKLAICRDLFRQLVSRMLVDQEDMSNELVYLQTENVMCSELGQHFLSGCTGLYFMVDVAEPIDLVFDGKEWLS